MDKLFVVLKISSYGGVDIEAVCTSEDYVRGLMRVHERSGEEGVLKVFERRPNWSFRHGELERLSVEEMRG